MEIDVKEILFAYSEYIRLRIILLLKDSEICVNCLVASLGLPQSTISRHLGILRRANVILANRKAQNTYYTANFQNDPLGNFNKELIDVYFKNMKDLPQYKEDRKNLLKQKDVCTVECKLDLKVA
jgi:ArsR family transcriptional regulator